MSNKSAYACLLSCLLLSPSFSAAAILNGDFEIDGVGLDPFADWVTLFGLDRPTAATDSEGQYGVFEPTGFATQLEQLIEMEATALTLSFDYQIMTSGTPNPGSVPDNFQSSLLDVSFSPILPADPSNPFNSAYFSIDNLGNVTLDPNLVSTSTTGAGLRSGWSRVSLDVRSAVPQSNVTLEFLVSNGFIDDGITTTVFLDNVSLSQIPEASSVLTWCFLMFVGAAVGLRSRFVSSGSWFLSSASQES